MNLQEMGQTFVTMVNQGREGEAALVSQHYADDVVTIEGADGEDMPARLEGLEALKGKHQWWYDNNDVHGTVVEGPFLGLRPDQFGVRISMDFTPRGGERTQMVELALITVADGKVVQEEYFYLAGG